MRELTSELDHGIYRCMGDCKFVEKERGNGEKERKILDNWGKKKEERLMEIINGIIARKHDNNNIGTYYLIF